MANGMGIENKVFDFVVIGAGVVGLGIVLALNRRFPRAKILVLEKEANLGQHASGRNSGVLHSGIYYPPKSLKAKLCLEGRALLKDFCLEEKISFHECGKIILPVRASDDSTLDFLMGRAKENAVPAELLRANEIQTLEPQARSVTERGIFCPTTAIFDSQEVLRAMRARAERTGVEFIFGARAEGFDPQNKILHISSESYCYEFLINAAGAHADKIASHFGILDWVMMGFKGIYYKLQLPFQFQKLLYPVPDMSVPFLGTHFTFYMNGEVSLGPTALPAMGRENYSGLRGIDWGELPQNMFRLSEEYVKNRQGFRRFAHQELQRLIPANLIREASQMVPAIRREHLTGKTKVGIRAQLYNRKLRRLEMDFIVAEASSSLHVLNAVSPGFTSALSFGRHVAEKIN